MPGKAAHEKAPTLQKHRGLLPDWFTPAWCKAVAQGSGRVLAAGAAHRTEDAYAQKDQRPDTDVQVRHTGHDSGPDDAPQKNHEPDHVKRERHLLPPEVDAASVRTRCNAAYRLPAFSAVGVRLLLSLSPLCLEKVLKTCMSCGLKLYHALTVANYITRPQLKMPVSKRDSLY
jgi:hypothetical protein